MEQGNMLRAIALVAAAALTTEPAMAAPDGRGENAVTVFDDLCVSMFTGNEKSEIDPARFTVTQVGEPTARKIKPDVKGPLWDVSGTKSDVRMLVHYEPTGLCVVDVAEADEANIQVHFGQLIQRTSAALGSAAQREPDARNRVGTKNATTSMWRMKSPKGDIMLAVTTYPDAKFMIQHLMTASYVK